MRLAARSDRGPDRRTGRGRWTIVGAVVAVVLMALTPLADAKVIGPPYTRATVAIGNLNEGTGCHTSKATHKLSFNRTSGVFAWANSATAAICPSTSGTTHNLTGAYSDLFIEPLAYVSIPMKVARGASSVETNWSWMAAYRLAYSTNGSGLCPTHNYSTLYNTSGAYGLCEASAFVEMGVGAYLLDLTNGSILAATAGSGPLSFPVAAYAEVTNETTRGYYFYAGNVTSQNYSVGPAWNATGGVLSGSSWEFYNYSLWASDKYALFVDLYLEISLYVVGYSSASASASMNAFSGGQGLKLSSVTVS